MDEKHEGSRKTWVRASRGSRALLFVLLLVAPLALVSSEGGAGEASKMPGPAPNTRGFDVVARNRQCESCHTDIAAEWKASQHRSAYTDPYYQRALAIEPTAFCRSCHAPEADPSKTAPAQLGALGVGCVSCHMSGHDVLASTKPTPRAPGKNAHPVVRDARFGSPAACASCHEFPFPGPSVGGGRTLMQSTVEEHKVSAFANTPCAECHMPVVPGPRGQHRRHDFSVNAALLRSAVNVSAVRTGPSTARITLTPARVGHAFPTGDLFRRLEVRAEAVGVDWSVLGSDVRYLARHWKTARASGSAGMRTVAADDRPGAGGKTIDLDLDVGPQGAAAPMYWRVTYQRVEHPRSESEADSLVGASVVVYDGRLPPLAPTSSPKKVP